MSLDLYGVDADGPCMLARRCLTTDPLDELDDLVQALRSASQPLIDAPYRGAERIGIGVHVGLGCGPSTRHACAIEDLSSAVDGVLGLELRCRTEEQPDLCALEAPRFCESFFEPPDPD